MAKLIIDEDTCKGCGLCTTACKKQLLSLNKGKLNARGYHPVGIEKMDECIGCLMCARICPDVAIEIEK